MSKHNHNTNSRDPLGSTAAADFYRHSELERALKYGKHTTLACFVPNKKTTSICAANCGHPFCIDGCSLVGQFD